MCTTLLIHEMCLEVSDRDRSTTRLVAQWCSLEAADCGAGGPGYEPRLCEVSVVMLYPVEVELTLSPVRRATERGRGAQRRSTTSSCYYYHKEKLRRRGDYYSSLNETLPLDSRTTLVRRPVGLGHTSLDQESSVGSRRTSKELSVQS